MIRAIFLLLFPLFAFAAEVRYFDVPRGSHPHDVAPAPDGGVWYTAQAWAGVKDIVPDPPSSYYYRNIYGCFFRDPAGMATIDAIGVDRITFETDYPHTDSTWPDTKQVAEEMFADLDDDVVYRITRGNAIEMLGLDLDQ